MWRLRRNRFQGIARPNFADGANALAWVKRATARGSPPRDGIFKGVYAIVYQVRPPPLPPDIAKTTGPLGGRKPLRSRVAAGRVADSTAEYFVVAGVRFYRRDVAAGVYEVELSKAKHEGD